MTDATVSLDSIVKHFESLPDPRHTGVKVTDEEVARLRLAPHPFHGERNYALFPRRKT